MFNKKLISIGVVSILFSWSLQVSAFSPILEDHLLFFPTGENKLSKDFLPDDLVKMKDFGISSLYPSRNEGKIRKVVVNDLKSLQDYCFQETGKRIPVRSGYRSFGQQRIAFAKYGAEFSAVPGTSEHQLGLAVDFGFKNEFLNEKTFPREVKCFHGNANRFGFILSYGKGNPFYNYESWHFRYVGKYSELISRNFLQGREWLLLSDLSYYQGYYEVKIKKRIKDREKQVANKKKWNEVANEFLLTESFKASIFLKRKILASAKNKEREDFRKYSSAYFYLKDVLR